jgi:hypothetical protein
MESESTDSFHFPSARRTNLQFISSITFESNSRLRRIESNAFNGLDVVITIPPTVVFVAFNAIPNVSDLFISDHASCPEFARWRELRKCHVAVDFRRILRVGSGTWLVVVNILFADLREK